MCHPLAVEWLVCHKPKGIGMAQNTPGKHYRRGISLLELAPRSPDEGRLGSGLRVSSQSVPKINSTGLARRLISLLISCGR